MRAALERCIVERLGPQYGPLTVQLPVWPPDADLVEERRFLTVRIGGEDYRLDTLVVRPAGATRAPADRADRARAGPSREMSVLSIAHLQRQARDLAHRGYLAVAVIRRGFGQSDGIPGRPGGGAYGGCGTHARELFDATADDLAATLAVIAERPDADANRVVLFGQSAAGPAVLALAARGLPGSARRGAHFGRAELLERKRAPRRARDAANGSRRCWRHTAGASRCRRSGSMPPTTACSPSRWRAQMHAIYAGGGAPANLVMLPPTGDDGHCIFRDINGRERWLFSLDLFLRRHDLPTWQEDLIETRRCSRPALRPTIAGGSWCYLSSVAPRVLVVDRATGRPYYAAADAGLPAGARLRSGLAARTAAPKRAACR